MRILPLLLVAALAGCTVPAGTDTSPTASTSVSVHPTPTLAAGPECPGHWHATFAIYVPGAGGQPEVVDMASPRAASGNAYYDLGGGAGMGLAVHMHQSGAERGRQDLGPTQLHFEQRGACTGVQAALHVVEADASATSLKLFGGHAQAHQDRTWTANATATLRWFLQMPEGGNWTWHESGFDQLKAEQLADGASLLVAFGDYTDVQVAAMQASIPAPISRL
ncbi:MAG: hypothetical protein QOI63_409 [Thermoplasmata archaeon]|nr:hypothetical protein [Thermoplasmata archaeon]